MEYRKYQVAVAQMDSREDREQNLDCACRLIEEAAQKNARLIAFPEIFNVIDKGETPPEEIPDGPTCTRMSEMARRNGLWILCGSMFEKNPEGDRKFNTSVLIDPQGKVTAKYRKLHTFDVVLPNGQEEKESKRVKPGGQMVNVQTELGNLGLSVCYDLRFPELYRYLCLQGAQILFVPAEFNIYTGKDHWEPLLQARAIENGCYVIAPAQMGVKNGRFHCNANSLVVDPWGTIIARSRNEVGLTMAEIDLDYLDRVRENIPSLKNRRADIYDTVAK